jgi:hypothetical protein
VESPRFLWKPSENKSINKSLADPNEMLNYLRRSAKSTAKKQMRPGPATQTAFVRGFLYRLVTAWWRNDGFGPTAFPKECRICQSPVAASSSCDHETATAAVSSGPSCSLLPAPKSKEARERGGGGGRNARATSRACARYLEVRRRFTLENRRLPLSLPQSFGEHRNAHVSLNPLSARSLRLATQKTCPLVQKLWRMRLACGRPWKTKN